MSQILFTVEIPAQTAISSGPGYPYEWTSFSSAINTILKPVKAAKSLQQNVWLLPAENTWPALLSMCAEADDHHLSYSVSLINGEVVALTKA